MQKIIIANFGRQNYLWHDCLDKKVVSTVEDEDLRPFWLSGDRIGYIEHCLRNKKTARGITPTRGTASRWFNIGVIVSETADDIWLHVDGDKIWWTETLNTAATVELVENPYSPSGSRMYIIRKAAKAWSHRSRRGTPLSWTALHPRARDFLFTESTLAELGKDNAEFANALVNGQDLNQWTSRVDWKRKLSLSVKSPVTNFDPSQITVARMVMTALYTVENASGQEVLSTVKNKECGFSSAAEFENYVSNILLSQDKLCALTSLPMQLDGEVSDKQMCASLDRIDSSRHYEEGNLQIVCRFVNRWKRADDNAEFHRLLLVLKDSQA